MLENKENKEDFEIVSDSDSDGGPGSEAEEFETNSDAKLKRLRKELKACQMEKMEHLEALQRAKADFLNSKRRNEERLEREIDRAASGFVEKLLPLCDSFDRAMNDVVFWNGCDPKIKTGIEAIHAQLQSILKSYGIEKTGTVGEPFDPNVHEAVSTKESEGHESDTILEVLQSGYRRGEELIRSAKVIIST